ncbi:CubicO group peptidase, beta-lactamase class C family [Maribacter orientalis]|uniref:CubicO group peptidase, beta-lactamase class C family n=1 Tax=Maribacter orientalis TaxID=228957 RepID=A0A1H7F5I1_9FLAO|nr:serine hydrolase domain-containing protein [Maribacter orientalis]SEK21359.1 CubicO group peptidase, beta-lactamase class C family [Maribacter orientalis]
MKQVTAILIALVFGINSFGQSSSNKELKKDIDVLFESYAHYNRFVGSVLISDNNTIIYQKSFGYADIESKKKNTKNSIFSIASLTKSLTAVGIMKLVEDGKLTLETPISIYFPDFMPNNSKDITIQHLLNNSSGMEANIGRTDESGNGLMPEVTPITLDELLEKFKASKLKFEPGTGYEYNNFGYLLLAQIIEKVSGQRYADFMEQAVFKPANMKNSAVAAFKPNHQKAHPYLGLGMNEFQNFNSSFHPSWLQGAADVNSTTVDLFKFMQALENGTLLKVASKNKLYTATQAMGVNDMVSGLGWVIDQKEGEKWIYNTGLLPGYASVMGSMPAKNIKIIILSNATSVNPVLEEFQGEVTFVPEITDKIISLFQGKRVENLALPIKNNSIVDFTNTYQFDDEHALVLKKEEGIYSLETAGKEPWSVFTYTFSRNSEENNASSKTALFFANAMSTQNFEGLVDYANEQMKGFIGTEEGLGQLRGMWGNFLQHAGKFISYNIYKIEGDEVKNVHVRFHFETIDVGMVLSINSNHKIQGMFMDDSVKTSHLSTVKLIPIGDNEYFINGHQNAGMQDLKVIVTDAHLTLIDGSQEFKGKLVSGRQ